MKHLIIALVCLFLVACEKEQAVKVEKGGFNSLVETTIKIIEKENEVYYELTLEQKIDPMAPTYVTNLRELKWINKLSYSLQKQIRGEDFVISIFHIKPLIPMDTIVLKRDDFEWYPKISGFAPITIETKGSNRAAGSINAPRPHTTGHTVP